MTIFPEHFKKILTRNVNECIGVSLLLLALCLLAALISYTPFDSAWNVSSTAAPQNFLGLLGAYVADFLLQIMGILSFLVPLWALFEGLSRVRNAPPSYPLLRFSVTILGLLLTSVFIQGLSFSAPHQQIFLQYLNWQQTPYMAGLLGGVCFAQWHRLFMWLLGSTFFPVSLVLDFVVSLMCLWWGFGLSFEQLKKSFSYTYQGFSYLVVYTGALLTKKTHRHTGVDRNIDHKIEPLDSENELSSIPDADQTPIVPWEKSETEHNNSAETYQDSPEIPLSSKQPTAKARSFKVPESIIVSGSYHLPPIDLLNIPQQKNFKTQSPEALNELAKQLEVVLEEFGIRGEIVNIRPGPVVTMYELKPAAGIKTSRVIGLADDIARSMSALSARIAVIPGQNVIGIELPNQHRQTVYMREIVSSHDYQSSKANLPLILGKDIGGMPIIADLARMPHLLVAGTTGSGKSVSVNTMILSLLFRFSPEQCKFIMIDPKMLELSVYDEIPHLLSPVVTDSKKAIVALRWAVREMENRYRAMAKLGVRNIDGFNTRLTQAKETGEILMKRIQTGFDPETGRPIFENQTLDFEPLPYIVVVVDEMADLMLVAGKEIEAAVQRLAQMARAAGIHLIMATQRPSVDVITGTIKANFPTRISFQVTSKIDSRTILGEQGAEQLLGQGDMLFMAGGGRISRVHAPFVSDTEIEQIVTFLKSQGAPSYVEAVTEDDETIEEDAPEASGGDDLYRQAVDLVLREGKASTSFIQRHLQIGYNRAARIIEQMEKKGIVSPANHVGKREVLGE